MTHSNPDTNTNEFSPIRFFNLFEQHIKKLNTHPFLSENIIVQADAFKRLAATTDDQPAELFATFVGNRKQGDRALSFDVAFLSHGFVVEYGDSNVYFVAFDATDLFKDEQDLAEQLLTVLKMLASGQIAVLQTKVHGMVVANETLIYDQSNSQRRVIATDADYSMHKTIEPDDYDFQVMRNSEPIDFLPIPQKLFVIARYDNGEFMVVGRTLSHAANTPLTREVYGQLAAAQIEDEMGKSPGESDLWYVYTKPETWLIIAVLLGVLYVLHQMKLLPPLLMEVPVLAMLPISFVAGLAAIIINSRRLRKKRAVGDNGSALGPNVKAAELVPVEPEKPAYLANYNWEDEFLLARKTVLGCCYLGSVELLVAAIILFKTLPQSSLTFWSPAIFSAILCGQAAVMLLMTVLYQRDKLSAGRYMWVITLLFIAISLPLGVSLKDNVNQGWDLSWVLTYSGLITPLILLGLRGHFTKSKSAF